MLLAPRRVIARRPLWVSVTRNPVVEACEQGRRLEQHAPRQRLVERSPKETAAEREIGALPGQRIDQYGDVGGAVLPIGIECHDDVSPLAKREFDAGLKSGALP